MAAAGWILLALTVIWLVAENSTFHLYVAGLTTIYAISALGLDWVQGRAGQVSIGSAGFMAIGAYVTAVSARQGLPALICLILACFGGAVVGLIVGLPALRLRHLYLALATLALNFIVNALSVELENATGQNAGFAVAAPQLGPLTFTYGRSYLMALVVVLVIVIVLTRRLYRRAPGRAWLAIKENQMAAGAMGINPTRWKLSAFVGSSAVISLSGGLLAYYTLVVSSETYTLGFAITFVVMVIIGGVGSIGGVVMGAVIVTVSPYVLSALTANLPFSTWLATNVFYINSGLYGIIVLLFLLYQPLGIGGAIESLRRWVIRRLEGRPATDATSGVNAEPPVSVSTGAEPSPERAVGDEEPVLRARDLRVVYRSGALAVDGIDLDVWPRQVVALLGRNGAGKTSTLRGLSGFFVSESVRLSGSIEFAGRDIRSMSPVVTSKLGLVMVPEREKVFPNLTVMEHLRLVGATKESIDETVELFPPLRARAGSPAGLLSGGERQMLALGVAFCMRPKLLLIDELSLGLAPSAISRLVTAVREYHDRTGVPVLLVEQNIGVALDLADQVYILEGGRIERQGASDSISREVLIASSLGA
jgi:branched-chain amino acid transport system permease protein